MATCLLFAVAGLLWLAFIRRAPEESATGSISSKAFTPAGIYVQQHVGANRDFRTPTQIPIAESYAFELQLDGIAEPVSASFNTVKSRQFEVGQRVRVRYVRRGLPLLHRRITVLDIMPLEIQ